MPEAELSTVAEAAEAYNSPVMKVYISRSGVSAEFVLDLMRSYGLDKVSISRLADVSSKTLDRYLISGQRFSGLQADRLLELADLFNEGVGVFGNPEKFRRWLHSKIPALNNTAPMEWLDTHEGITLISNELGRIKYGIFA